MLEAKAPDSAAELAVTEFKAFARFVQNSAQKHCLRNVALWRQHGLAINADRKGEEGLAEIRRELAKYDLDHIFPYG